MKVRIAFAVVTALAVGQLPAAMAVRQASVDRYTRAAVSHLKANADEYGVSADDLTDLRLTSNSFSRATGAEYRYLRQQVQGLDVLEGDVTVTLKKNEEVAHVGSRLIDDIAEKTSGSLVLTATEAVEAAASHLGLTTDATLGIMKVTPGIEHVTAVSPAGISREPISARLAYQPSKGELRLVWQLVIDELARDHWWDIMIDAETGAALKKIDWVTHEPADAHGGTSTGGLPIDKSRVAAAIEPNDGEYEGVADGSSYTVYPLPYDSPVDGPRHVVNNPAHPLGSPFGWHDTDASAGPEYKITRGNNVHAYADFTGPAHVPLIDTPSSDGNLTFDHPIDFSLPPQAWRDAAVTNLFYWNNVIHDVFYNYEFDEWAGNFQTNQYGRAHPSRGNDHVVANAQDTGGVNNANFATPPDGSSGRMQMYLWAATAKRQLRDGDLDAPIIIHEYGHGISIRLTGGAGNSSCLRNDEQGGEGWSDYFAIVLTALGHEGDFHPDARRGLAIYSEGGDKRSDPGIRNVRYWPHGTSPTYNAIKTAAVPHGVGEVWAHMLWDMTWTLIWKHGFNPNIYDAWNTGGNNLALQLVIDGLKLQPCSPGFVDARDAILAAADLRLAGSDNPATEVDEAFDNKCLIWSAFAKRGLGYGAMQGSSGSATDGVQDFGLPPGC